MHHGSVNNCRVIGGDHDRILMYGTGTIPLQPLPINPFGLAIATTFATYGGAIAAMYGWLKNDEKVKWLGIGLGVAGVTGLVLNKTLYPV